MWTFTVCPVSPSAVLQGVNPTSNNSQGAPKLYKLLIAWHRLKRTQLQTLSVQKINSITYLLQSDYRAVVTLKLAPITAKQHRYHCSPLLQLLYLPNLMEISIFVNSFESYGKNTWFAVCGDGVVWPARDNSIMIVRSLSYGVAGACDVYRNLTDRQTE